MSSNSISGAVSGGFAGRVASRACSSPPSFRFQPVSPSLRLGWFCGLAPGGLGPFPVLPSFVFVLAATLAACCAAMALEVLWKDAVFKPSLRTDFSDDVLESWGVCDAFWTCETEFGGNLSVHESDFESHMLKLFLWTLDDTDLENHVLNSVDDGYENVNLGSGPVKVCSKEIFPKTLSHESKVATFEFQARPLFDLIVRLVCNWAVLVALQVQAFKVGAKTYKVSGEVEEERKKEGEEKEKEYAEEEEKTKEKQDEWESHAFSLQNEEEEDGREERSEDEKEEDMLRLSKVPCFQQKAFPVFVEGVGNTFVVMISPQVEFEDFVEMVQTKIGLSSKTLCPSWAECSIPCG